MSFERAVSNTTLDKVSIIDEGADSKVNDALSQSPFFPPLRRNSQASEQVSDFLNNRQPLFTKLKQASEIGNIIGHDRSPYSKTTSPGLLQ